MNEPACERLELFYSNTRHGKTQEVRQTVALTHTVPNFGGRRWWMRCPVNGSRVAKLYLPPGGDIFASRQAWRLGYQSQRNAPRDQPFERLFRLQEKLGCPRGWGNYPQRPKRMWRSTYERLMEHFEKLDLECDAEMARMEAFVARGF